MQEKPLESVELDLLAVIRQIHAEEGPFGRDLLLVRARGRGLEVSRPLGRLKDLGLVEEIERKPSVLRRLFGAKPEALLRPTAAGLALGSEATASETTATAEAVTEAGTGPEAGTAPQTGTETEAPALTPEMPRETVEETTRETAARAPATAVPSPAPAPAPSPAPAPVAPAPRAEPPVSAPPTPRREPTAPVAPVADADAAPLPMPRRAKPRNVRGYTEELGGSPVAAKTVPLRHDVDPAMMENLREALAVIGIEMTFAGEALIADRMGRGSSIGEALSQVVLFAFAHAVAEDARAGEQLQALGLTDYAVDVIAEFERLRDAGEIDGDRLEEDMRRLWTLVGDSPDRLRLAEELLQDPVGGLTPPALLPEDLRPVEEN
ncbi:hypothetical protein M2324_001299 [Rhodovulum sulfidophilum]|uniref:hypothetical protein n=1 Tax=Rhodovulum sulfidophilum TaxID=35806 RepID=UPI0005A6461A|nr:hypothetical protein [Rhodovulum sulfidophilum]ANB33737.1 hypothetical protein A6W98_06370 [Rhodovulum sulfidophilum DSM 1374]ANB37559.1 hypothetical protein A6024_06225 [Rhodovulum sulfidophilum]MCW2302909.1 hypothetical protein [Rhodovulum sulfidophilum]